MSETKRSTNPLAEEILGRYFPVLDHGFVALVDYMGSDEDVERAARVSYQAGTRKQSETKGLIRYLRRHKHTTPSEMVELKFHCSMPIFIARQWIRHRTANVNETSGRYSLLPMLFYTPEREQFLAQSKTNKQGRGEALDSEIYNLAVANWKESRTGVQGQYEWLASEDVARELARIDLPLSTYTQWYWKIDLHNLIHFLTLRVDSHAQWEMQQFGRVMAGMMKRVAPLTHEAWIDYDVCSVKFSRAERILLQLMLRGKTDLTPEDFASVDLSTREIDEFKVKFTLPEVPNFDLDLSVAKPPEFFEAMMAAAAPKTK
jgi:thymidylate synthase (FAD)